MDRVFIGIAWPYANGPFHLGHLAGAYLPGDIFARYHRLAGAEVLMVSGSDMHGTPVLVRAEKEGRSAREVAEQFDEVNRAAFRALGVSFDLFTSTHTPVHERTVQEVFLALLRGGYVDRRTEEYAYCPKHARFLPDRYVNGECPNCGNPGARGDECDRCGRILQPRELLHPVCALDGTPAEFRPSEHFFLRLDKLAPAVEHYLADKDRWRDNVLAFTRNFQKGGLRPTPITRDLDWGVPIPLDGYPTKVFYVWFEAVIGYLSAAREWALRTGQPDAWHRFWDPAAPVRAYYFVGKDNIYYHTIFWPAMLLGVGDLQLPYDVPANEWLVLDGGKLSKSRSPSEEVSLPALLERYPPDVIRFYAALLAPERHDTEFQWSEFRQVTEQVLANQWGNLVQRLLVFVRDQYGGKVPSGAAVSAEFRTSLLAAHERIARAYEAVRLKEALEIALEEVRAANRRFHEAKPWASAEPERLRAVAEGLAFVKAAAVWLAPVLPHSADSVFRMLGYAHGPAPGTWGAALEPPPEGQKLGEVKPLYPNPALERTPRVEPAGTPAPAPTGAGTGGVDRPVPLEIRAGEVLSVAPHPSADRLYQLEVDLGEHGQRTVVAGLRPYLQPSALQGQRVLLLANLKPRTIRSVTSHGMLLAAEAGDSVALLHPPASVPTGRGAGGLEAPARPISIEEFEQQPLRVGTVIAAAGEAATEVNLGERTVTVRGAWSPGTMLIVRTGGSSDGLLDVIEFGPGAAATVGAGAIPGAKVR